MAQPVNMPRGSSPPKFTDWIKMELQRSKMTAVPERFESAPTGV